MLGSSWEEMTKLTKRTNTGKVWEAVEVDVERHARTVGVGDACDCALNGLATL